MFRNALREDSNKRKELRTIFEEKNILKRCDGIIVHNEKMKSLLMEMGFDRTKLVSLQIFDYLTNSPIKNINRYDKSIIIAGNLRKYKAGYVYKLPAGIKFNLYGIGYEGEQNQYISYFGSYDPDILPSVIEGAYGLVWDGDDINTCSGVYGSYLKINNPHKTSFYLACGLPVIIWKESALADFICENHCGILIDSLNSIKDILNNIDDKKYQELKQGAILVGNRLRSGYYAKEAMRKLEELCYR